MGACLSVYCLHPDNSNASKTRCGQRSCVMACTTDIAIGLRG